MPAKKTAFGTPQLVASLPFTTGKYLFVCNASGVSGSNGNTGLRPEQPLATVDYAIGLCDANRGDVIVVMPGHAETVTATNIALDVAGVQVVGIGTGLKRPIFTYGAAAATITVSAANCSWSGCDFLSNFLDVASAFTLGAAKDFTLGGNRPELGNTFRATDASKDLLAIITTGSTANAADGLTVQNNYQFSLDVTTTASIVILGNLDRLYVADNVVDKAATNDAGQFITIAALVIRGARIFRNVLNVVGSAGAAVGVFMTGSSTSNTGIVADNYCASLDTTGGLFSTAALNLALFNNSMTGDLTKSGTTPWPAADAPS